MDFIHQTQKHKMIKRSHYKNIKIFAGCVATALMLSACSVSEEEEICDPVYKVQFVYDMNMDYADAFAAKVGSVNLYVFDAKTGENKGYYAESGAALAQDGYTMTLDLKPGNYDFVAWCGLADNDDHFTVAAHISNIREVGCQLSKKRNSAGKATSDQQLNALYHGQLSANLPDDDKEHLYTVKLVKNTNNINVTVQDISGNNIDPERFTFTLQDENGVMDFDNTVLSDEEIDYLPYRKAGGSANVGGTKADENTHDIILAELSTARLISNHNPIIKIQDNQKNQTVYSIPLVKWALMYKSEQYSKMDNQEYLDRQDEYNVMIYVSPQGDVVPEEPAQYVAVGLFINGWRIVDNGNTELH